MPGLFDALSELSSRPEPYSHYTTLEMWNDDHISRGMLTAHLDGDSDRASRNALFMQRSVSWTKSHFRVSPSTRIVDFGCGPGLYTTEWARAGAVVTGIDASRRSIAYAAQTAAANDLAITYLNDDYLSCPVAGTFDLVTMIFCDFCVLNPEQRRLLIHKWKSMLNPNGRVLFDVASLKYFDSVPESRTYTFKPLGGFWSDQPYHVFENTHRYDPQKLLLEHIVVVEAKRTRVFYNWLQCFSVDTIRTELENEGLSVREYYSNVAGDPYTGDATEIAVVAAT